MRNALIFDDNKILAELVQMKVEALFRKYGLEFEVDRMSRLSQLEACDKTYQLAFMDIVLPEQDGIDITRQWKNSGRFEEVFLYPHMMIRCLLLLTPIRCIL